MHVQAIDFGINTSPTDLSNRLFCKLDGLSLIEREQIRAESLKNLGLLETETISIFDEATQMAARFIETPICILTLTVFDKVWIKSAVGLSRLGLMNQLATDRKIDRQDAFCTYVVDSQQPLSIENTLAENAFAYNVLTQDYGIRSYLGAPLMTAAGQCIGSLSLMDLIPRHFTDREIEFVCVTARWCMGEFERDYLLKKQLEVTQETSLLKTKITPDSAISTTPKIKETALNSILKKTDFRRSLAHLKLTLLNQLTQELRSPLTSVIGMSSVLKSGIFGKLTQKQQDYLGIIHSSGEHLNALVDEILKVGTIEDYSAELDLVPVNIEMLAQRSFNNLSGIAKQKRQEIRLSIDPGNRIWLLDKIKVKQALYYLVVSVIETSEPGGEVRVHICDHHQTLNISFWMYHPWIGNGLPHVHLQPPFLINQDKAHVFQRSLNLLQDTPKNEVMNGINNFQSKEKFVDDQILTVASLEAIIHQLDYSSEQAEGSPNKLLGLLLGCYLAESHNGKVVLQGSSESGYRYVFMLPKIPVNES